MERNLEKFAGQLPYASELYGVHHPLLGWRSRLTRKRVENALRLPAYPRAIFRSGASERPVFVFTPSQGDLENGVKVDGNGSIYEVSRNGVDLFAEESHFIQFETPDYLDGLLVRSLQEQARPLLRDHPVEEVDFWIGHWTTAIGNRNELNKRFLAVLASLKDTEFAHAVDTSRLRDPFYAYVVGIVSLLGRADDAFEYIFNREVFIARHLNALAPVSPLREEKLAQVDAVNRLLLRTRPRPSLAETLKALDPLALTTGANREGVLTPIGILHIFRQFFFEFDSFLGPAVEHIWLAPGSTTELIEVSTRRTLVEETLERSLARSLLNETSGTVEDELSLALKAENQRDTKQGVSVSAGATILVAHGEASASMSVEETQRNAREENHRTKRQQSNKLASEIRLNVKTAFRTVTETTDTRSKRHVIENKIGPDGGAPRLVNYELRRKMRQVGVQTQDVGTQLCWQVFVDNPGLELGVGQLVHLAAKSDLSKYASQPFKPPPSAVTEVMTLLVPVPKPGDRSTMGPIAASGFLGLMAGGVPGVAAGVAVYEVLDGLFGDDDDDQSVYGIAAESVIRQEYKINLPPGYVIAQAPEQNQQDELFSLGNGKQGEIPIRHISNGKDLKFRVQVASAQEGRVFLVVDGGEVTCGELLEFQIRATIKPTPETEAAVKAENAQIAKENAERTAERDRRLKEDFVNAVRDRVKLASEIRSRSATELREEERTVIYRSLISRLMRDAWSLSVDRKVAHLRSEFIRSIFDVDKMFYAVAPEWWQPRRRAGQSFGARMSDEGQKLSLSSEKTALRQDLLKASLFGRAKRNDLGVLGSEDLVGWGGEGREDNYLITESSAPARLGSSLGWLLQLDGDNLRNAFLNAPWVKAVIPIRAGREREALEWLEQSEVEGSDGLDAPYAGEDAAVFRDRLAALGNDRDPTIREVLYMVADDVAVKNKAAFTTVEDTITINGEEKTIRYLPPERVFEFGFDPLAEGFRPRPASGELFGLIDQWVEVLPTDQIAAVQVEYDPKTGRML